MTEPGRLHRHTYAEYIALEMVSEEKHEFLDGEIYAMAGGSAEHAALALEIGYALRNAAHDRGCRAYSSDLRIYVEARGLATYPDGSVICGPMQKHESSPDTTALNPMVLVEVTSDSSEKFDRGAKREQYQTIPTLRDYVLVSHRERRITVHTRGADGTWTVASAGSGDRVGLSSLGMDLVVDEVYRDSTVP